jgi:hypothetical protein
MVFFVSRNVRKDRKVLKYNIIHLTYICVLGVLGAKMLFSENIQLLSSSNEFLETYVIRMNKLIIPVGVSLIMLIS